MNGGQLWFVPASATALGLHHISVAVHCSEPPLPTLQRRAVPLPRTGARTSPSGSRVSFHGGTSLLGKRTEDPGTYIPDSENGSTDRRK